MRILFALLLSCAVASGQKISDLTRAAAAAGTNTVPIVTAPNTANGLQQITIANLFSNRVLNGSTVFTNGTVPSVGDVLSAANANGLLGWVTPSTGDAGGTNSRQIGTLNLTNWSNIPTGAMANVVAATFLTNWANAISNLTLLLASQTDLGTASNTVRTTAINGLTNKVENNAGSATNLSTQGLTVNTNLTLSHLTASRVAILNGSQQLTNSATTDTELGYVSGVTSAIQTQLNAKGNVSSNSAGGITSIGFSTNAAASYFETNIVATSEITGANLVSGWTNNASFGYNTFTVSGANISSAIESGAFGIGYTSFPITSGAVYRVSFTLTLNSGSAPQFDFTTDLNAAAPQYVNFTKAGTNRFYLKSSRTGTEFVNWVNVANGNWSVAGFQLVRVTPNIDANSMILEDGFVVQGAAVFKGGVSSMVNLNSEVWGQNASANTNEGATIVGSGANTGTENTYAGQAYGGKPSLFGRDTYGGGSAFGDRARATNFEAIAVGPQSIAGGLADIAFGNAARAWGGNGLALGDTVWKRGNGNYIVGGGAGTAFDWILAYGALGNSFTYGTEIATDHHQGFFGWYAEDNVNFTNGAGFANNIWIGGPQRARAPHDISLNTTSLIGTDSNGVHTIWNASAGTGTGTSGNLIYRTAKPSAVSGTNQNTYATMVTITGTNTILHTGFSSLATATNVTQGATGVTNTIGVKVTAVGVTGVSVTLTTLSTNTYALGTITVPRDISLKAGEYLVGTSMAYQGAVETQ